MAISRLASVYQVVSPLSHALMWLLMHGYKKIHPCRRRDAVKTRVISCFRWNMSNICVVFPVPLFRLFSLSTLIIIFMPKNSVSLLQSGVTFCITCGLARNKQLAQFIADNECCCFHQFKLVSVTLSLLMGKLTQIARKTTYSALSLGQARFWVQHQGCYIFLGNKNLRVMKNVIHLIIRIF